MKRLVAAWVLGVAFCATVWAANWAIATYGLVPVGFGLMAPAGVYVAGLAFTLRDALRETGGRRVAVVAILAGAGLSAAISGGGRVALASGLAFLVSEGLDAVVYERLRASGRARALLASNVAGLVLDSVIFLALAFGSLDFLLGQVVGKGWITLASVLIVWLGRIVWVRSNFGRASTASS